MMTAKTFGVQRNAKGKQKRERIVKKRTSLKRNVKNIVKNVKLPPLQQLQVHN